MAHFHANAFLPGNGGSWRIVPCGEWSASFTEQRDGRAVVRWSLLLVSRNQCLLVMENEGIALAFSELAGSPASLASWGGSSGGYERQRRLALAEMPFET